MSAMTTANSNTVPYKHCSACGLVKPNDAFRYITRKRGGYLYTHCRECEREYNRRRNAERKFGNSLDALIEAVGTPPCDTCFRRDRCARDPVPCWRFDVYVEGVSIPQTSESPDRSELAGRSINL
jgi:hypothetical protein